MIPDDSENSGSDRTQVIREDQTTLLAELKKAKEQDACLIIIRGSPQGHRFMINQKEVTIGRDPAAEISINDQGISRRHAKVTQKGNQVELTDLGSSNGTFLNDKKIEAQQPKTLAKEDMIKVGNTILKYVPAGHLETLFYGNLDLAAHSDPLTKIYNKGYLLEALDSEFKRAKALHSDFSVLFFDLDHFKKINDTYGHDAGDYVLKEITSLVKTTLLRPKDIFARYGGEEFVILLSNTPVKAASEIAERIRAAIQNHGFIYDGKKLPVTSSLGVASMKDETESGSNLLKLADQALYQAKSTGRNRVVTSA